MKIKVTALLLLAAIGAPRVAQAQKLTIDPAWSEVAFNVSNFGVNTVYGRFDKYVGTVDFEPLAPEQSKVHVVIQATSVNTQNKKRDKHLRTDEFFDADNFPELTFESQSIEKKSAGYEMKGTLTLKGKSLPVTIPFTFSTATANGKIILHAQGRTEINRHDYGIDYGSNFSVGKTISIRLAVAATE